MASILVYSHGEVIGDGVIKLPWIGALRAAFPDDRLVWCAASGESVYKTSLAPLAARYIDEFVEDQDLRRRRRGPGRPPPLGGRRFEVVIDTQSNWREALMLRRAAAGRFISPAAAFLFSSVRPGAPRPATLGALIGLLFSLAAGRVLAPADPWSGDAEALAQAEALLPHGPAYVGVAPGAGGPGKRWPAERFVALGARLAASGLTPVFLLGPGETELEGPVRAAVPSALVPDTRALGPRLVIALGRRLAAAVANDAGPGHMLAAGGAPLVSLQRSARQAAKFRPQTARLELMIAEGGDMASLALDDVEAALRRLLAGGAQSEP